MFNQLLGVSNGTVSAGCHAVNRAPSQDDMGWHATTAVLVAYVARIAAINRNS
jgi:hypothetical protein